MALMVLILVGISLGWLTSILSRTEAARQILSQIGLALIAALSAGLAANSFIVLDGISLFALGIGCAAAMAALVCYHAVARPKAIHP